MDFSFIQKREKNPNITLKLIINHKGREKKKMKGTKKTYKNSPQNN